ncbi:MAG: phospholipase [Betaproteobacteria bacterium HGW-Betaproteobacteria-7]|jgi:diguanylate cyclase (GGDEF)-like protein|nr:MAG: phospholipase [Betaproteobacteria bacterium HGW-Betaproteobacteria-7]
MSDSAAQGGIAIERALRVLSAGNRVLIRATDEMQLLNDMCRVIVDIGGYAVAVLSYLDHGEQKSLPTMACAGIEKAVVEAWGGTWRADDPRSVFIRRTITSRSPQVSLVFSSDPDLLLWQEAARREGVTAISQYPLIVDGEVLGLLLIGTREEESLAFGERELATLNELAEDLAFGIETLRIRARHEAAEQTIRRMAYWDSLTDLPNRTQLKEKLTEAVTLAKQAKRAFALLMLNVDRFRDINEVLGYAQGDLLLIALSQRLRSFVPEDGLLARMGVDEFAVLAPGSNVEDAKALARRMLEGLYEPFDILGCRIEIRASIGIAICPGHGTESELLILRADAAMYQAKRSHREMLVFAGDGEEKDRGRLAVISELRQAIETSQLRLYYQPKVELGTRTICGAEALVRWEHPERGVILPGHFIPMAERTGLIHQLTHWMINAGFAWAYHLNEAGITMPLAVNLSARNLEDSRLVDRISGLMATWGGRPEWMQFELTESALMEDTACSQEVLGRLSRMGFKLLVDDFGTGYSSLSYLQRLPVDALKIDQSFVRAMLSDDDTRTIVRSTVEMAHNIGLEVVAEGVENRAIWDQLHSLGADFAQGWYISEPFPAEQFDNWRSTSPWHLG